LPYNIVWRREGDVISAYANPEKAKKILGREAECSVEKAVRDMWNYQNTAKDKSQD
jgi:UDP-glucose 4-epimerase